jgi:SAM-dependent methyltransferase
MARIDYDDRTAGGFKSVREIPREGLEGWREALHRHLRPVPGMTVVDVGAGTGAFTGVFADWFAVEVVAVEPAAAMRARIPVRPDVRILEGHAAALPLPDGCADAAWLSTVIHHIPDLPAAAREIRRVLRSGAPVLIRSAFPGRCERIDLVHWFPETARTIDSYPTVEQTREVFAAAGFLQADVEPVPETRPGGIRQLLDQADVLRGADTTMRNLTYEEFDRGRQRLRRAAEQAEASAPRTSWLDLLVLR